MSRPRGDADQVAPIQAEIERLSGELSRLRKTVTPLGEVETSSSLGGLERRVTTRFETQEIRLAVFRVGRLGSSKNIGKAFIDISLQGMAVVLTRDLDPLTQVRVKIELPSLGQFLSLSGEVRWSRYVTESEWKAGIAFTGASSQALGRLRHWIDLVKEKPGGSAKPAPIPTGLPRIDGQVRELLVRAGSLSRELASRKAALDVTERQREDLEEKCAHLESEVQRYERLLQEERKATAALKLRNSELERKP